MKITRAQFAAYNRALDSGSDVGNPRGSRAYAVAKLAGNMTTAEAVFIFCNYEALRYGRLPLSGSKASRLEPEIDSCGWDPSSIKEAK